MTKYSVQEIVTKISEVPTEWIYKFFYAFFTEKNFGVGRRIGQPFDGRTIKVRSIVNRDSNPSLCFFYKNGNYYWKDFSTGVGGNSIKFVAYHAGRPENSVEDGIMRKYEDYINGHVLDVDVIDMSQITRPEYDYTIRPYTAESLNFWNKFKIQDTTLSRFKMRFMPTYTMKKGGASHRFNTFAFGYFNNTGLCQIYQPMLPKVKYLNINTDYLLGSEQLEFKSPFLGIISGLKDIAAITEVGLDCEYIASSSENTLVSGDKMDEFRTKYKFIFSMLDNDEAGFRAMDRYKKVYGIPSIRMKLKQDLAKNNETYPLNNLKFWYTESINKIFNV